MNNENDSLHDALREASPDQLQALAELATWMAKHHRLLVVGRWPEARYSDRRYG
ncbi:hypothetical protein [Pseudomonas syringae]|uniref:hypothetical protein n=1 Tax=Pseudomonas syringae TaxID=317 RepID=UPI001CEF7C26|nr:hypothetical protein [Pseudomonas syringae]